VGAAARYLLTGALHRVVPGAFPIGTTAVNILGSLLVGVLAGVFVAREGQAPHTMQLLLVTGFCGGFTTFSALSLETIRLIDAGAGMTALGSVVLQLGAGLAATLLGLWLVRSL
jgi:CrcB protein